MRLAISLAVLFFALESVYSKGIKLPFRVGNRDNAVPYPQHSIGKSKSHSQQSEQFDPLINQDISGHQAYFGKEDNHREPLVDPINYQHETYQRYHGVPGPRSRASLTWVEAAAPSYGKLSPLSRLQNKHQQNIYNENFESVPLSRLINNPYEEERFNKDSFIDVDYRPRTQHKGPSVYGLNGQHTHGKTNVEVIEPNIVKERNANLLAEQRMLNVLPAGLKGLVNTDGIIIDVKKGAKSLNGDNDLVMHQSSDIHSVDDKRRKHLDWSANGFNNAMQGKSTFGDIYFVAIVAGCSAASIFGVISAGYCFYRFQQHNKSAADVEYPAYGVVGPATKESVNGNTSPSGDRKLAQSAQMYHYHHQKQQMIASEKAAASRHTSASDVDSEEENEEGDYTVYECPGLAGTGEMEVKNPLFQDDITPVSSPQITSNTKEK